MSAVLKSDQINVAAGVLDRTGIGISALCLGQCAALALVVIFGPAVSLGIFAQDLFHLTLLAVIFPVSLLAFGLGFRRHGRVYSVMPGLVGLSLLILAAVLELGGVNGWTAAALTASGGLLLIASHLLNIRARRQVRLEERF